MPYSEQQTAAELEPSRDRSGRAAQTRPGLYLGERHASCAVWQGNCDFPFLPLMLTIVPPGSDCRSIHKAIFLTSSKRASSLCLSLSVPVNLQAVRTARDCAR
jgi:hypothetical protein